MDAPSKPLFTLMTLMNEPSLEGLSKPETIGSPALHVKARTDVKNDRS
jgi:hypothetical protein